MPKLTSNKPAITLAIEKTLKERMEKFSTVNWSEVFEKSVINELGFQERIIAETEKAAAVVEGWVTKDPRLNGSGTYRLNGEDYRIVCDKSPHGFDVRFAYLNGRVVTRASKFSNLLKKLKAMTRQVRCEIDGRIFLATYDDEGLRIIKERKYYKGPYGHVSEYHAAYWHRNHHKMPKKPTSMVYRIHEATKAKP